MAAQSGFEEVVHELMSAKDIDIDQANDQGVTPLSVASNNGHRDVVLAMLASGVDIDVNQTDNEGDTPLTNAASMGHLGMVQVSLTR
jgi:ankyrin repeat protein